MDLSTLAAAQDKLGADLEAVITQFLEDNEGVRIQSLDIDLWSEAGPKVRTNVSADIDGARVNRSTQV